MAFKRNKNLRDIIGGNKVFDNKKVLKVKKFSKGKCQSFFTRSITLYCKQLKTCKSGCVIYLMECCFCEKLQYVGKFEYSVNLRIKRHRNNVWRTDGPPCDKHFQMPVHNFNTHANFTINEEINNKSLSELKIRNMLEHRENFRILKLQIFPRKV